MLKAMPSMGKAGDETVQVDAERTTVAFCSCVRVVDDSDSDSGHKHHKHHKHKK